MICTIEQRKKEGNNVRTDISSGIGYEGEVTLKLSNGKTVSKTYTLHNRGKEGLWKLLARAVTGYDVRSEAPRFIDVVNFLNDGNYVSCLKSKLKITGGVYGDLASDGASSEDSVSAKFTTVLTANDKISNLSPAYPSFVLYSNNAELAIVKGKYEDPDIATLINSVANGIDVIIEWKMTFKNV